MTIKPEYIENLPVRKISSQVNDSLRQKPRLVITAPPGSGKSTLLPLTILEGFPEAETGRVIVLEPRRAAARQIAMRMAHMIGEQVGETVGYRMRFEQKVSAKTRVEVVTEGVMERMLIDDPTLDGVAVVIFDEFHERSLTADLTLALTLEAQNVLRPDLRIVLMSATIDSADLCNLLDAPLIEEKGTLYDVENIYCGDIEIPDAAATVASVVRRAYREQDGDILAFLPGQGEIMKCVSLLEESLPDAMVMPLYGVLSSQEQYRALEYREPGRRKIVVATPIAETSLTIEGIRTVVDSGLYRVARFEPSSGLSRLVVERISADMARQRAGRAGRLSNGVCYRLWSKAAEHRMKDHREPEIVEADLSGMVLDIAAWGGCEPDALPWITIPSPGHLAEARRLLKLLGAIDENGRITDRGRRMASLPCHPRLANMLVSATGNGMKALAADIAALLEEKDPVDDENDADINTRIEMLRRHRARGGRSGQLTRIARIATQYRRMVHCEEDNSPVDIDNTGALLAKAYPERIAMRVADCLYRLANGNNVRLNEADDLCGQELLAVASMDRRIFLASPLSRESALGIAAPYNNLSWNSREGKVIARGEMRIGALVIDSKPLENPDRNEIIEIICRAAEKEWRTMFDFSQEVAAMQQRILTVAEWHPELGLPDVSDVALVAAVGEWLPMYIGKATGVAELRKIDLCNVIGGMIGYENMALIDRLAPTHIKLPCGRRARVEYRPASPAPVVSARLQDCLGLTDTPRLDDGRRPVLMELLSPGFKPVQITADLRGFWTGTYFDVRKELRRRYPKHRWPENPLDYNTPENLK